MQEYHRWYDDQSDLKELFKVFRNMSNDELDTCSRILYEVITTSRSNKQQAKDLKSVGPEKIQGFYKSFNKRRWYDQNKYLCCCARFLSIMCQEEAESVVKSFFFNLKIKGLSDVYDQNKIDV